MIKYVKKIKQQEVDELEYIECNCCHKKFYPWTETLCAIQEFIHIRERGGYGSIFGDGSEIECDLCQHCVKKLLGAYLRVGSDWLEKETERFINNDDLK